MSEMLAKQLEAFSTYEEKHTHVASLVKSRTVDDTLKHTYTLIEGGLAPKPTSTYESDYTRARGLELDLRSRAAWNDVRFDEPPQLKEFFITEKVDIVMGRSFGSFSSNMEPDFRTGFWCYIESRDAISYKELSFVSQALQAMLFRTLSKAYASHNSYMTETRNVVGVMDRIAAAVPLFNPNNAGFEQARRIETERVGRSLIDACSRGLDLESFNKDKALWGIQERSVLMALDEVTAHKVLQRHNIFPDGHLLDVK